MINKKQLYIEILKNSLKVISVIAVTLLVMLFFSRQITKIANSLEEKMVLNSVMERKNEIALRLDEEFKTIAEKDKKIEGALLPIDNILEFVGALESLAAERSLDQSMKFNSPVPASGISEKSVYSIDYSLILNGNISTLIAYLKGFEKLPYFTGISSVAFNSPSPSDWNDDMSISVQAKLYVKNTEE